MSKLHRLVFPLTVAATLAALATGCASSRVAGIAAPAAYPAGNAAAVTTANTVAGACQFSLKGIDDLRQETGLGNMGPTRVGGEGFKIWFENGITAVPGYRPDTAPVTLRIEVIKAYIQSLDTMKSANLVVRVYATNKDAALPSKVYRGVDNSTNWGNSESEIQTALNRAMKSLQLQIGADVGKLCKG